MTMERKDVLRDYLDRLLVAVRDHQESFSESLAVQIEQQVRREWAGERSLIRKDPDREKRREAAAKELRRTGDVQQVKNKYGMSRSAVYGLFERKK